MLFVFWEITTVLSFLLISYSRHPPVRPARGPAGALLTTSGGLAMLVGI